MTNIVPRGPAPRSHARRTLHDLDVDGSARSTVCVARTYLDKRAPGRWNYGIQPEGKSTKTYQRVVTNSTRPFLSRLSLRLISARSRRNGSLAQQEDAASAASLTVRLSHKHVAECRGQTAHRKADGKNQHAPFFRKESDECMMGDLSAVIELLVRNHYRPFSFVLLFRSSSE